MRKRQIDVDLPPGVRRLKKDGKVIPGKFVIRAQGKGYDVQQTVAAKTPMAAALILEKLRAEASRPKPVATPSLPTLGDYARSWLEARVTAHELKQSTIAFYGMALRIHILPVLGHLRVDEIRRADIMDWLDRQDAKSDTVNARLRTLRTVVRSAVIRYELQRDPTLGVRSRRRTEPMREKALAAEDLEKLLEVLRVDAPQWYPLVLVLGRTGMRFGEASALQWTDVDQAAGTITIRRSQTKGHVGAPKNGKARVVAMSPDLAAVLEELRKRHVREQVPELSEGWLFMGRPRDRENTLPTDRVHIQPSGLRRHLDAACAKAGIRQHVSAHSFRHTANNLLRQHDPLGLVTRSAIGHSDASMTARYSNVVLAEQAALMRRAFPAAYADEAKGTSKGTEATPGPETNAAGER